MFNKTAGTGQGSLLDNGPVGGLCMDLAESLNNSSLTYDVIMTQDGPRPTTFLGEAMGSEKAAYLSELWGRFFDEAWITAGNYTQQQNDSAEAFAAAVWEIIYEDLPAAPSGWDVTVDGTHGHLGFRAANLNSALANSWLHALDGAGPIADLRSLSYAGRQDFLVAIPEPSMAGFLAMGFLLLTGKKFVRA
jgi:hypothetical protein